MKITLGLIQMSMSDNPEENIAKAVKHVESAVSRGAQIVALPELFTSPYFPQEEKADAAGYADTIPGNVSAALSKVARENDAVIVGGSIFEKDGKSFYNTSMVFDEKGKMLGKYRKMHIPHDPKFYEQDYFKPGDLGYQVFDTKYGRIATLICYDQWFPEAARTVALMGADIIFYPTAIGTVYGVEQAEGSWQDAWTTVQRGHAIANGVAVASINRVGREGGMQFWGGSFISSQFGNLLARGGDKEQIVMAQIDVDLGKAVREGWGFFSNRRPETYGKITEE